VKVGLLTREYPPDTYGGAGVHVEFLARSLRPLVNLDVHCWGADRPDAERGVDGGQDLRQFRLVESGGREQQTLGVGQ